MQKTDFATLVERETGTPLRRSAVTTLQVNLTARCNLACHHCHVESGPRRSEAIDRRIADRVLWLLERSPGIKCLDLTGGAPEMSDQFRFLVEGARAFGLEVIDRCNLTVFFEPGYADLPEFLARHHVTVVASLPCWTRENVEAQRGRRVFEPSIEALRLLNARGYGRSPERPLDLVYNPQGCALPPSQTELEARYRDELRERFGIGFRNLYAIANMPIRRFAASLLREGRLEDYHSLLVQSFNPEAVPQLMCRQLVSVGWDGQLYDCDFNQQLGLPLGGEARSLWDVESLGELTGCGIATRPHCFACTAGAGSSCGGALT